MEFGIPTRYVADVRCNHGGSFGIFVHCEEEISPKRLAAVPWAPFCIRCQEQADRNNGDGKELFHEMLVNAA